MQIYISYSEGCLRVIPQGELDHHEARDGYRSIARALDEYMPRTCVLDLSKLHFMDSSGIALILKVNRAMGVQGGRAWIENAWGQPLKVLEAAGIGRLIRIKGAIA